MKLHMTDLVVSRLQTPGTYYDEKTPAFAIRVGRNRKTWFVIRGRKRLRTNIGQYPKTTLAEARKEAKRLLAEEPSQRLAQIRFAAAYDLFKAAIAARKARTQYDYKRVLDKYLLPSLGTKKLSDIAYEDVTALTDDLPPSEQAHALAVTRTFFRWCVRPPRRYIAHSPLDGVQVRMGKPRKRVLKDDELVKVWNAALEQGYPHGTIVQLLILTGQRKMEIGNLRRSWIDQKERTITLPDWVCKNSKEHVFPYGDLVACILDTVPHRNTTDLLFPSRVSDERPLSGWSKYKKEMKDAVVGWTLHDLRRTFRTNHAKLGTSSTIGERLINHAAAVTSDVELVYDVWTYLPEMREAVSRLDNWLTALLARKQLAA